MEHKMIRHPELGVEAEVAEESVPGWLEVGWELKDDGNVSADTPAVEAPTGAEPSAENVEES